MKTKKRAIVFIISNFIIITSNIISKSHYRDLLLETIPEHPYPYVQTIIKDSIGTLLITGLLFYGYPIYRYFKKKRKFYK